MNPLNFLTFNWIFYPSSGRDTERHHWAGFLLLWKRDTGKGAGHGGLSTLQHGSLVFHFSLKSIQCVSLSYHVISLNLLIYIRCGPSCSTWDFGSRCLWLFKPQIRECVQEGVFGRCFMCKEFGHSQYLNWPQVSSFWDCQLQRDLYTRAPFTYGLDWFLWTKIISLCCDLL